MGDTKSDPNWIEKATAKNKGALRKKLGAKPGKDISAKRLHAAERSKSEPERREATLAATLKSFHPK
jgi:hypothetical protein